MNKTVPFVDLITPHREMEDELLAVFREAIRTASFIGGPVVENFEKEFAEFCSTKYCVGVASGTDALRFALMAAGLDRGEVVVTVANSFIATTEAISQAGGVPAFVDVDEHTYNMDPAKLREFLENECHVDNKTGRPVVRKTGTPVAAVIPVHLYGQMADMDAVLELAEKYRLIVIEDACQAHGAEYYSRKKNRWYKAGSMGHAAAFSFYPGKNMGACGEGGAVTTNNEEIAGKVRMLRDHGQTQKYFHRVEGYNGRLDAIQAGILRVKLRRLAEWNESRRQKALLYNELLESTEGVEIPFEPRWSRAVYHLYIIRNRKRDELQKYLFDNEIYTGLHYPIPLHLQVPYRYLGYREGYLPVSERLAHEILSLPMYPGLQRLQQERVAGKIIEYV